MIISNGLIGLTRVELLEGRMLKLSQIRSFEDEIFGETDVVNRVNSAPRTHTRRG